MRSSRSAARRLCALTCVLYLLCCACALDGRRRGRRSHPGAGTGARAHHRPLTEEQKADQNLQFMLSLYRSAAGPDGRPKQHRKFGSNTVRMLRPAAASVHYLPAPEDLCYTFTVQYKLDTLPSEQLVRASFVHLRSPSSTDLSGGGGSSSQAVVEPLLCRAQIASLGAESLVTLEPHERWTETDITAHVSAHILQRKDLNEDGHLRLTAQYWCREPDGGGGEAAVAAAAAAAAAAEHAAWWWSPFRSRKSRSSEPHLEVPSLLLYLEEEREVKEWMGDLLGVGGEDVMRRVGWWHPSIRRRRSSSEGSKRNSTSELKDSTLDPLDGPGVLPPHSIFSDIPNYKTKAGTPKNRCKLHSFRLSFDELGWGHYFIAPPVYNPRYCQGDCPRPLHYGYHSPNHAIIQTVISELGVGDVPPPSCVPHKYMPMSVLVVHKKKVEYRELEDMVAESCTCR